MLHTVGRHQTAGLFQASLRVRQKREVPHQKPLQIRCFYQVRFESEGPLGPL